MRGERRRSEAPAWDPPLTVALLVAGVVNVTVTVAILRMLPEQLQEVWAIQGLRVTEGATALASTMANCGIVAAVLALVVAIGIAVPRLRMHRTAFWVPLVAAAASLVVVGAFVVVAAAAAGPPPQS